MNSRIIYEGRLFKRENQPVREINESHVLNFAVTIRQEGKKLGDKKGLYYEDAFLNCVAWGDLAVEIDSLPNGSKIHVEGVPEIQTYEKDSISFRKLVLKVKSAFIEDLGMLITLPRSPASILKGLEGRESPSKN